MIRSRIFGLAHHSQLSGHTVQTGLQILIRKVYYWQQIAVDIMSAVQGFTQCVKNRMPLIKKSHHRTLLQAKWALQSVVVERLGPHPRRKRGFLFILCIADRF